MQVYAGVRSHFSFLFSLNIQLYRHVTQYSEYNRALTRLVLIMLSAVTRMLFIGIALCRNGKRRWERVRVPVPYTQPVSKQQSLQPILIDNVMYREEAVHLHM